MSNHCVVPTALGGKVFMRQLHNILLCGCTISIHCPSSGHLAGFQVCHCKHWLSCVSSPLNTRCCIPVSHHSTPQPMPPVAFRGTWVTHIPWLEFSSIEPREDHPCRCHMENRYNPLTGKGKPSQSGEKTMVAMSKHTCCSPPEEVHEGLVVWGMGLRRSKTHYKVGGLSALRLRELRKCKLGPPQRWGNVTLTPGL